MGIVYQCLLTYSHICQTQSSDNNETVTLLYQRLYLSIQSMLKTILLNILVPGPGNLTKKCSNLRIWKLVWQQCPELLLEVYFYWKVKKIWIIYQWSVWYGTVSQTLYTNLIILFDNLIVVVYLKLLNPRERLFVSFKFPKVYCLIFSNCTIHSWLVVL